MGLFDFFDFIGGKIRQAGAEAQEAQMEAERWDAEIICKELQKNYRMTKISGYMTALSSKCQKMSDRELKDIFDYAFNSRNAKACTAMMTVMEERGLAYEDDNGRIVRTYR